MPPKKDTTTKKRYSWNNTREPRIPKEIKSQGLDAINRWITYNRLAKADLIGIIMEREDKDKKRKKGDDSDDETDDEDERKAKKQKTKQSTLEKQMEILGKSLVTLANTINKTQPRQQSEEESEEEDDDDFDLLATSTDDETPTTAQIRNILKKAKKTCTE
eukprot:g15040.t1